LLRRPDPPDDAAPERGPAGLLGRADPEQRAPLTAGLAQRSAAGLAAGGLVLAALVGLGPEPSFSAPAAAGIAALAVALLPRIGWILATAGTCAWLVSPEADRQGTALVLAAAAAPVPFLLPRAGLLWSAPVLAPLLGTIALGPLFVGIAALAPSPWRRAGLAAAGFLWLVLGEALTGKGLLFGSPDGTTPRGEWEGSISAAVSDVLQPLATTPAPAPLFAWALFAAALPLLVRGRWLALDLVGAGLWALGLALALLALGDALAADVALAAPRGAVGGAVGAGLVVLAVSRVAAPAAGWRAPRVTTA
ncbi:MAG TPA: hypothetical protein VEY90_02265, partial [Thermoleophilaceae bacterium]|nr:hypothetical protein [Thermoleophilaceae bacterium]